MNVPRPGTEYTKQRAEWFDIPLQKEGESDGDFRRRVAGALRDLGKTIEAHEALNNCLFDDPEFGGSVVDGLVGFMAMQNQGIDWGGDGARRVDDEEVAGSYVRNKRPDPSPEMMLLMINLLGRNR